MDYVRTTKRLLALNLGLNRAYAYASKHPNTNIDIDIEDKIATLKTKVNSWMHKPTSRHDRILRYRQIKLACRLLKCDFYKIYK